MTLSDELIVADVGSFDWGQKDQKVFLNWSDATLGILSACSLLLVSSMAASGLSGFQGSVRKLARFLAKNQ